MPRLNNDKADKGYERWKNTVLNFLQIKRSYERESKIFEARKKNFYAEADEFFETKGKQSAIEEREIFLMERLRPFSSLTSSRNFIALSKLSSGSPIPIITTFEILTLLSLPAKIT